jgi:hypothetical protein
MAFAQKRKAKDLDDASDEEEEVCSVVCLSIVAYY